MLRSRTDGTCPDSPGRTLTSAASATETTMPKRQGAEILATVQRGARANDGRVGVARWALRDPLDRRDRLPTLGPRQRLPSERTGGGCLHPAGGGRVRSQLSGRMYSAVSAGSRLRRPGGDGGFRSDGIRLGSTQPRPRRRRCCLRPAGRDDRIVGTARARGTLRTIGRGETGLAVAGCVRRARRPASWRRHYKSPRPLLPSAQAVDRGVLDQQFASRVAEQGVAARSSTG
jgi:hypothetical protein